MTRKVLTSLVYYLLLPALVLSVLWKAQLGDTSVIIATSAAIGILTGVVLSTLSCRLCKSQAANTGAIVLAATFPNATYLGLPVLEATFGPWARSVAIQYDLFACTPLLFTLGVLLAARFGNAEQQTNILRDLLRIPALWAALLAVALNFLHVPQPSTIAGLLGLLERGVVPLMLFSLGLSLEWNKAQWRLMPSLAPVMLIRLIIIPAVVMVFASAAGLSGDMHAAVVLESAMPSMVIGIVLCDKFNLNVSLYASAVTVSTILSLFTLPMWFHWLQ
jgi:predicted permease